MNIAFLYIKERIATTVYEHISAFKKYSTHSISYYDIFKDPIDRGIIDKFDVIVIHYTISIFNDDRFSAQLRVLIRNSKAIKVVFIQDEYRKVNDVIENLNYLDVNVLFTLYPENTVEKIYPIKKLPNLTKIYTLTGFVSEELVKKPKVSYINRSLDVVYRARKVSAWLGSLGQEKWEIAKKFREDANSYQLKCDIEYEEKHRIYGENWIDFLSSSKAMIGCESGTSLIDFTGDIQKSVEAYEQKNPKAPFKEIEAKFFAGLDKKIMFNVISPRCFEAASLRTLMVLYEGEYSGILLPWRHYVPLKRDHSNMEEVVRVIKDPKRWEEITQNAYKEIALSPQYSHETFIKGFDQVISNAVSSKTENPDITLGSDLNFKTTPYEIVFQKMSKILNRLPFALSQFIKKVIRGDFIFLKGFLFLKEKKRLCFWYKIFKKGFYEEIFFLKAITNYSQILNKIDENKGFSFKSFSSTQKVIISLDPDEDIKENERDMNCLKVASKIVVQVSPSWGIPKNIRGKEVVFRHINEIKELLV